MKYYVRIDDKPSSPTYLSPLSLHRWGKYVNGDLLLERWDTKSMSWVDNPELMAASGIGGANNYVLVPVDQEKDMLNFFGSIGVAANKSTAFAFKAADGSDW